MSDIAGQIGNFPQMMLAGLQQANVPIEGQKTQALSSLLQQQSMATNLENQQTQMRMPIYQRTINNILSTMSDEQNNSPSSTQPSTNAFAVDPADVLTSPTNSQDTQTSQGTPTQDGPVAASAGLSGNELSRYNAFKSKAAAMAQQQYAPPPTAMDPQTATMVAGAQTIGQGSTMGAGFQTAFEAKQQHQAQVNMLRANQAYQNSMSILAADDPKSMMRRLEGNEYNIMMKQFPDISDDQIKEMAKHAGAVAYQYSGREFEISPEGVIIDKRSGQPVLEAPRVGLSDEQRTNLWQNLNSTTDDYVNGSLTHPSMYKKMGYSTPWGAFYSSLGVIGGNDPLTQPPPQQASPAQQGPAKVKSGPSPGAPGLGNGPSGSVFKSENSTSGNIDYSTIPKPSAIYTNGSPNPSQTGLGVSNIDRDTKMKTEANQNINQANNDNSVDRQIMQRLSTAATGPGTEWAAKLQTFLNNFKGTDKDGVARPDDPYQGPTLDQMAQDPASRQVINKLLNVRGIGEAEKNMGSVRFSALMGKLTTEQLSANADLIKPAILAMSKLDVANNAYDLQKYGQDFNAYKQHVTQEQGTGDYESWYGSDPSRYKTPAVDDYISRMDNLGNIRPKTDLAQTDAQGRTLHWSNKARTYYYQDVNNPNDKVIPNQK